MGCDIHAHSEIKVNGQWHHMEDVNIERNYDLFAKMAGVRSYGSQSPKPIAEPRDLPEDISLITKLDAELWGEDGHSHSWLSAAEVCELGEFMQEQKRKWEPNQYFCYQKVLGSMFGYGWEVFTKYPDDKPEWLEDARLVFWFDN